MTKRCFLAPRMVLLLALAGTVSGCMMNTPPSRGERGAQDLISDLHASYNVRKVNVIVPRNLTVSEDNSFKPSADIVWHGEAQGDRYQQVERIVRAAMQRGTATAGAGVPVVMDVQVIRFHALTPKTRASFGGKHELEYMLTLRDVATGQVLLSNPRVIATVRGAGGAQAVAEEAAGRTQAVVIEEALAASVQRELAGAAQNGDQLRTGGQTAGLTSGGQTGGATGGTVARGQVAPEGLLPR